MSAPDTDTTATDDLDVEARIAAADAVFHEESAEPADDDAEDAAADDAPPDDDDRPAGDSSEEGEASGEAGRDDDEGDADADADGEGEGEGDDDKDDDDKAELGSKERIEKRKRESLDARFAQVRRKEQSLEKRAQAIAEREQQVQQQLQQAERWAKLPDKLRTDPLGALDEAAQAAGLSADELFERMTQRRLTGNAGSSGELADLRRQIAEQQRQLADWQRQQQAAQAEQQREALIRQDLDVMMAVKGEAHRAEYPHLARLPDDQLKDVLERGLRDAVRRSHEAAARGVELSYTRQQILDELDNLVAEQSRYWSRALGTHQGSDGPAGSGSQASNGTQKPATSRKRGRTVTNRDAAETGSGLRRELSDEDRIRMADDILFGRG